VKKRKEQFSISKFLSPRYTGCWKANSFESKNVVPGSDRLLNHKQKLRKLSHQTRDPACKMAVHWVIKTNTRMTQRKALEWWEAKTGSA